MRVVGIRCYGQYGESNQIINSQFYSILLFGVNLNITYQLTAGLSAGVHAASEHKIPSLWGCLERSSFRRFTVRLLIFLFSSFPYT